MKIKMNIKLVFPFIIPIIISLIGKYNTDILIGISSFFIFLGVILMFNPTWITKPNAYKLKYLKQNLKQKFNGYENDIDEMRLQLLRDFRLSYVGYSLLGSLFLGTSADASNQLNNALKDFFLNKYLLIFFGMLFLTSCFMCWMVLNR